jgi:hypothetical protein
MKKCVGLKKLIKKLINNYYLKKKKTKKNKDFGQVGGWSNLPWLV